MSARLPLKSGSSDARGDDVSHWQRWGKQYASAYGDLMGPVDGYYGNGDAAFTREMQRRLGLPQTGVFDELTASRVGYGGTVAPRPRRKIWLYSSPGSGADWNVGPSFALGEWCKDVLKINHQPLSFQKGGYLGLLGGDAKFSYNEVTYDQYKSLEYCLDHNPDINDPNLELWFSGYSQSADGMEDALEILFGDGGFIHPGDPTRTPSPPGKYRHLRDRINGVVQFGNPSTPVTGIARKARPAWLAKLVRNVNARNDFYAVAPDNIRPAFYAIIVQAELELPFFVHVLRIAVPIITDWATAALPIIGPLLGGFGPTAQMGLGMISGLQGMGQNPLFGNLMGQAGSSRDTKVDDDLRRLLSPTGVLQNIPGLISLVAALPGLQAHGEYHLPKPEFGGRDGIAVAYDIIAGFRR